MAQKIEAQRKYQRLPRVIFDYAIAISAAVAIALAIRHYFLEAYRIPTPSMFPTLYAGDTIFVLKTPHGLRREPRRGDIIIYAPAASSEFSFVKRILGVPGDTVQVRNGEVILNGSAITSNPQIGPDGLACLEEKIPNGPKYLTCHEKRLIEDFGPLPVQNGHFFVIGDLRSPPRGDTREGANFSPYGMIEQAKVRGLARWIWLSVQPAELTDTGKQGPRLRWERMFRSIE